MRKKNIFTFFQEPSFFSRTFFFFIIPYLWLWWTLLFIISLFFFLIMVKHFCLSSSSLLHNGVQLSFSSSCSFVDMIKALLLHCHPFWTPSPHYHHLLPFFAWKWWTPKVGLFKLFLLICTIHWKCAHCQLWLSSSIVLRKTKVKRKMWWIK